MVPFEALDVMQIQIAQAKSPAAVVIGQFDQPVCHLLVISIELALVPVEGLADSKCHTGDTSAHTLLRNHLVGHLPSARWPHHFFSRASETISALSFPSRYIFFKRRFSSSSSFMRDIMDTSMPPYLARHL